jgi:uncharacterized protein YecT (DUF1311 family)
MNAHFKLIEKREVAHRLLRESLRRCCVVIETPFLCNWREIWEAAMRYAIAITAFSVICATPVSAQDIYLSRQKEALDVILETANSICFSVKQEGQMVEGDVSGTTRATLDDAVSRIKRLDLSGTGKLTERDYRGVQQEALPRALESSQACKRAIFDKLVIVMIPRVADTGLPISKSVHLNSRAPEHKPSIDCSNTNEPLEELLCADDDLAQWDGRMGQLYRAKMQQLSLDARRALKQQQLSWIRRRNVTCNYSPLESYSLAQLSPAKPCILQMTKQRVEELSNVWRQADERQ